MNRNNFRAVLEEIIQCTGIDPQLPEMYTTLTPEEQVKVVMSLIPKGRLESAQKTNKEVWERLMCGEVS